MSDGIPMERMTPEEIARLKLRYTNRDGSTEVLCSKAWAHITLQGAEIEKLRADIAYADAHAAKVESLLWGTAKEREKLRAALERLLRAKNEKDAHGDTPVYQALKAGAWDEACAVLSASQPAPHWRESDA